jgi:hypothetical protein
MFDEWRRQQRARNLNEQMARKEYDDSGRVGSGCRKTATVLLLILTLIPAALVYATIQVI